MKNQMMSFTRLVLVVSAVVQITTGSIAMFSDELWNGFFWPDPLPPFSELGLQLGGAAYLATAIAAIYALKVGTWESARVYLAYSFPYIIMAVIFTLITIAEHGGAPIGWLYLLLSALYLPIVAYTWRRESRASAPERKQEMLAQSPISNL